MPKELSIPLETAGRENVSWLAGLLEGEGSFGACRVSIQMTDLDTLERASRLMGSVPRKLKALPKMKPLWGVFIYGQRARLVMEMILPWMGERRATTITRALANPNLGFPDSVSVSIRRWQAAKTPAERSEISRRASESRTPEERLSHAHHMHDALMERTTPEERSAITRRAWATRRARNALR